ncbi:MAG: formylglycine-generating enzyme family protein [Pseudomonadota bacterium]
MKRVFLTSFLAGSMALLAACDRADDPPPVDPAPPPPVETASAAVSMPETVPAVSLDTVKTAPKPAPDAPLPAGFVKVSAGELTGADGRRLRTGGFAIARQPITLGQLRAWAESEGGRRLPQFGSDNKDADVATDLDWMAADAYARWLAARENRHYRLPSEAEWLRAAQSGRIATQAHSQPTEPPLWEWTGDCWNDGKAEAENCASRVLVGGEMSAEGPWGRAPMGARRPAASFRLVLELR